MASNISVPPPENRITQTSTSDFQATVPKSPSEALGNASSSAARIANPYNLCGFNVTPDMITKSFNVTLKFISPGASSGPFCRICHEGDNQEDLVSLCKCTGSVGLVHLTCMERWLSTRRNAAGRDECELCHYTFETIRYPKSITEWYQSEQGPMTNRHSVLGDIACFSLITPLAAVSAYLCFEGARRHVMWNNSLEAGCLMALATFLITVYIVWNVLTVRFHLKSYYRWRTVNQNVRLLRYRRRSSTQQVRSNQVDANVSQNAQNGNSSSQNTNSSQHESPNLNQTESESATLTAQTPNVCLAVT